MRGFLLLISMMLLPMVGACGDDGGTPPLRDSGVDTSIPTDTGTGSCSPSRTNCSGSCVLLESNPAHCGACGNACALDETCVSSMCRPAAACPPGQTDCGAGCQTLDTDQHCGRCGEGCEATETCTSGSCQPDTCPAGQERCEGVCTDTQADSSNCGACGTVCEAGEMCTGGACVSACPAGQSVCEVVDDEGTRTICVDLTTDSAHCGACGDACPAGQGCDASACACPAGTEDCAGVCVNTETDPTNCGGCGTTCRADQECTAASGCACTGTLEDCDGSCVNTDVSNVHCGGCDIVCGAGESCSDGACMAECGAGSVMCGADCANLNTDDNHCGACDNVCSRGSACDAGVCRPDNDQRADAIDITLPSDGSEASVTGSTVGATRDGAIISGCAANGPNVWYRVTTLERGVLWADTASAPYEYDTALFVTDASGDPVAVRGSTAGGDDSDPNALCNDDCCDGRGDFSDFRQSCVGSTLPAGTYYISVGGFVSTSVGDFTLNVQFMPETGFLYTARLNSSGVTSDTLLIGTSEANGMCDSGFGARSGEDMRWFASCGEQIDLLSTCPVDGGAWEREASDGRLFDSVLYIRSGQTGTETACNDDGGSGCGGYPGNSTNFGSRISTVQANRGINAVFIDSRGSGGSGMNYELNYSLPDVP